MATYTPEQYAAAAAFIQANIDNPQYIAEVASSLGVSLQDLTTAVQTVAPDVTVNDVSQYFESNNVDTSVFAPPERFTQDQYEQAGQWIAQNINNQDLVKQTAQQLGLTDAEVARAAQTVNPEITTKEVTNYLSVPSQQEVNNAVITAIQNGFTVDELRDIAKTLNIPEAKVNSAFETVVGSKASADIIRDISAMIPAGQSITFDKIVKYADDNKLPYATVGEALKSTFQNTTADQIVESMVYEKDRQQFNTLVKDVIVDGKPAKQVDLGDAIAESIKKGISLDNLSKFYGKTQDDFKSLVNNNITNVALTLRESGIDAAQGLSDLLGTNKDTTNQSLRLYDASQKLNNIATTDSQGNTSIPLDKAIELAQVNKISDDDLSKILNLTTEQIATTRDKLSVQKTLNTLAEDGKITVNELLGAVNDKNMSIEEFVNKYITENKQPTIDALKTESKFSPQERSWREAYSSITTPINIQQAVDFQTANNLSDADMERIFNIPTKSLDNYRLQTELPRYAGEDQRLSYNEIIKFADDNKISLSDAVGLIGTKEEQPDLLSKIEAYNKLSATEKLADQLRAYIDPKSSGGAWTTKSGKSGSAGFGTEGMLQQLAQRIVEKTGVDDLEDLGQRTVNVTKDAPVYKVTTDEGDAYRVVTEITPNGDQISRFVTPEELRRLTVTEDQDNNKLYSLSITTPVQEAYNKKTGEKIESTDLGGWAQGPEFTWGTIGFDASGKPVVSTYGESSSDAGKIMPVVAFAAAFIAPQLLTQIIGSAGMTASAATQAAISAGATTAAEIATISSALTAGTGLTGSLIASGVSSSIAPYAASMIVNGTLQGLIADASDGSFAKGFLTGGVAPVIGQLATNAVNTALSGLNLPSGFDRAVGNAVTQLIATGEIDPKQMLVEGVTPAISNTIQQATGLNAAQTKLLLNTIVSEGQNLQALTDPTKAINFINQNKGVFDGIGVAAASGKPVSTSGQTVDLGAFNEGMPGAPLATGNPVLGQTGQDVISFLEANNIYSIGPNKYLGVSPGTIYNLSDIYGYGDGTMADVRSYGDAGIAELMAGFTKPTIGTGDARIAEIMASVNRPDQYQMDLVGAEYGTPYSVDWDNIQKTITKTSYKLSDSQGNSFDIPAGATLVKNARGDITGYNSKGVTYVYADGEMMPRIDVSGVATTQETPTTVTQNIANFGSRVMDAVTNTIRKMESSDSEAVRDVANTLKTNINLLGELVKGTATTVSSPAELFTTLYNGNPNNPISEWASNLKQGISAAQAAADPKWAETKQAIEKQLTAIGADKGQIEQAMATVDAYANNPRMLAERIVATVPSLIPGVAAFKGAQMLGASTGAAYVIGAGAASTVAQSDLKDMANATYTSIRNTLKAQDPSLSSEELDIKAAAGTAMSMRQAGALSLGTAFSLQMLPIPNIGKLNSVVTNVARETTQEVLEEPAMKVLSNIYQGKPLNADLGRTAVEAIFTTGPIAAATSALGADPIKTSKNVMWELLDAAPSTQLQLLTNQQNQIVTNSKGQPILIEYRIDPGLQLTGPSNLPVTPSESYTSDSVQSVFDVILNNESKFGYTVNGVSLDGQTFSLTGADGKPITLSSNDLLNNALNVVTQQDPTAARTTVNGADIASRLAVNIAQGIDLNGVAGDLSSGTVLASNDRGVFITTPSGDLMFAPNYGNDTATQGVATAQLNVGDQVILGKGFVSPSITVLDDSGKPVTTIDQLKVDPLAGLSTVIGLNDSQALVVMPNQQIATVDRANLSTTQNNTLSQGSKIPVNQQILSGINIPVSTIQDDFGLTQSDLLRSVLPPTLTSSNLPYIVPIISPAGTQTLLNTQKPNIGVGTVISTNDQDGTALISTATGNPQVVNMQGSKLTQGSDIFFDPSTGMLLGTPIAPNLAVQTQPQTQPQMNLGQSVYTPIGMPTPPGGIDSQIPPVTTTTGSSKVVAPPITTIDTVPSGLGVDTIPGGSTIGTPGINIGIDTIPTGVNNIPTGTDTTPGGAKTPAQTPAKTTSPKPFLFPIPQEQTKQLEFGYPVVPPPELSGTPEMPYPNYLRPLDPYLGYGIGALMGDFYDEKQGYGGYQPSQNAESQIKIPA